MRKHGHKMTTVLLGLALLVVTVYGQRRDPPQGAWEYKIYTAAGGNTLEEINKLGADGWELVDVEIPMDARYYFKRPKR